MAPQTTVIQVRDPGAETVGVSPCPLLLGALARVPAPASGALCLRSLAARDHSAHMYSRSKHQGINCPWEQPSTDDSSKLEDKEPSSLALTGENPEPRLLLVPQLQVSMADTRLAAQGRLTSFSIPVTSPLLYQGYLGSPPDTLPAVRSFLRVCFWWKPKWDRAPPPAIWNGS